MRKKAILMSETLRLIIAVISLLLLAYLLVQLYGLFTTKTEYEQAKSTLNAIVGKIEFIAKEGGETSYLITGPKDWYIRFFEEKEKFSKDCDVNKKSCACVCKAKEDVLTCQKKGVCKSVDKEIELVGYYWKYIEKIPTIAIVFDKPLQLFFKKDVDGKIIIYTEIEKEQLVLLDKLLNEESSATRNSIKRDIQMFVNELRQFKTKGSDEYGLAVEKRKSLIINTAESFLKKEGYDAEKENFVLTIEYKLTSESSEYDLESIKLFGEVIGIISSLLIESEEDWKHSSIGTEIDDLEGISKIKLTFKLDYKNE